jgi:hypothetical protein
VRALFLLLVLANVAFLAWTRLIAPGGSGADPAPLAREIEPQKIRVVPPEELSRLSAPKPAAVAAVTPPPRAAAGPKCFEWGAFSATEAARAQQLLEPLALGERLAERKTQETAWWVFIPPQPAEGNARQVALRKAGELKKLGVQDYFIVQEEGPNRWAVSLGVFRSEEAAQAHLAALRSQGVRSARVGEREAPVPKIWLQVNGVDAALEERLGEIARQIDNSELRECVP